jgi:hypothetical protein
VAAVEDRLVDLLPEPMVAVHERDEAWKRLHRTVS